MAWRRKLDGVRAEYKMLFDRSNGFLGGKQQAPAAISYARCNMPSQQARGINYRYELPGLPDLCPSSACLFGRPLKHMLRAAPKGLLVF
jgi:hypothetical protein